ncbi:MBL fold metallo-hydrolase [Sphingobium chungbukense]|uniref:Beta-lactamase n=1 Tax=Sphingobium chungbukense TaxID=56193 RepID=A0A0M3ANV9_9SPHN|nr:MBL fold metallo-hydrolase [Sphingobium chungbukense]KKW91628.1 beta-lactamase [Sphingobium chungbukense]
MEKPTSFDTYRLGDITVTRIPELSLEDFPAAVVIPEWDPDILVRHPDWITPGSMDPARKNLYMQVHSWLVRTPRWTILIDTGVGNDKPRPFTPGFDRLSTPFLERLAKAGAQPEDIDYVLMTHLHVDHVGWNTRLEGGRWVPTFPNARYLFSGRELQYFTDERHHNDRNKTSFIVQRDSVLPLVDAGVAELIEVDGSEVLEGFAFQPTPGHSIDHASITVTSRGETAIFPGDTLHHPIQIFKPEWNSMFDAFEDEARTARKWVLDYAANENARLFSTHFPESAVGEVRRRGDGGFEWQFV